MWTLYVAAFGLGALLGYWLKRYRDGWIQLFELTEWEVYANLSRKHVAIVIGEENDGVASVSGSPKQVRALAFVLAKAANNVEDAIADERMGADDDEAATDETPPPLAVPGPTDGPISITSTAAATLADDFLETEQPQPGRVGVPVKCGSRCVRPEVVIDDEADTTLHSAPGLSGNGVQP